MIVFFVIQKTCIHISVPFNTMYGPIKCLSYYILVQVLAKPEIIELEVEIIFYVLKNPMEKSHKLEDLTS